MLSVFVLDNQIFLEDNTLLNNITLLGNKTLLGDHNVPTTVCSKNPIYTDNPYMAT